MRKILKDKKAITLIALVITIVVLVILAAVTISMTVGNNGLIAKAIKAANDYKNAQEKDKQSINDLYGQLVVAADGTIENLTVDTLQDIIDKRIATQTKDMQDTITAQGEKITELEAGNVPRGTVIAFYKNAAPGGYIPCDGTTYDLTLDKNKHLIELAKLLTGNNNPTSFKAPDLRGEFLRGTGTNSHANQGSGSNVGTHQDATLIPNVIKKPSGAGIQINTLATATNVSDNPANVDSQKSRVGWICCDTTNYSLSSAASSAGPFTTRPTNTSVLYCIKY